MYDQPNIPKDHLRACLQEQYDLAAVSLEFLPVGADYRAGVYRVASEQGGSYLLKVRSGAFYEASCLVSRYLRDQGIAAVVAPLPTRERRLWTRLEEWVIIVYPFIEGETGWNPSLTAAQWQAVGTTLCQIHQVRLPPEGVPSMRRETFDPTGYRRSIHLLETEHIGAAGGSQAEQMLRSLWLAHQSTIHTAMASLEKLAGVLEQQSGPLVICHADLHPGNIIRSQANQVHVIDWDDVMLAPKERDFLFVGEARSHGAPRHDAAPFFQGYGQIEVDWVALTYYLWERAVQDLLYDAEGVFLGDDLGGANKAAALKTFQAVFTGEGNEVEKALAAAAHLPADLHVHNKEMPYEH